MPVAGTTLSVPPFSAVVAEIPDQGPLSAWIYGEAQFESGSGPQPLVTGSPAAIDAGTSTDVAAAGGS